MGNNQHIVSVKNMRNSYLIITHQSKSYKRGNRVHDTGGKQFSAGHREGSWNQGGSSAEKEDRAPGPER